MDFITGIIDKCYARKIDSENLATQKEKRGYPPHQRIYNPKKPSSIRVVFDCSACYQGPDLTSKQTGVLIGFREERVTFMAEIEKIPS